MEMNEREFSIASQAYPLVVAPHNPNQVHGGSARRGLAEPLNEDTILLLKIYLDAKWMFVA